MCNNLTSQADATVIFDGIFNGSLLSFKTADIFALIRVPTVTYAVVTIAKGTVYFIKEYGCLVTGLVSVAGIWAGLVR